MNLLRRQLAPVLFSVLLMESAAVPNEEAIPAIGSIDLYGLRTVSAAHVRQALDLKEGDPAPVEAAQRSELEKRIIALPKVVHARIAGVCCDEGKASVFVGIEEKGAPQLAFRRAPSQPLLLPRDVLELHQRFETAFAEGYLVPVAD